MFKCQHCDTICPPRQPQNRVVHSRREKEYQRKITRGRQRGTFETIKGWEIAKEIVVCPDCYQEITGMEPQRTITVPQEEAETRLQETREVKPWRGRGKGRSQPSPKNLVIQKVLKKPEK